MTTLQGYAIRPFRSTPKGYSKEDVEFHRDGYTGPMRPAVNVKVYKTVRDVALPLDLSRISDDGGQTWQNVRTNPHFTHDWIEEHVSDEALESAFQDACTCGWEYLEGEAQDIFGRHVKVYSEGRSGGWAVVEGLKDFDDWDATDLAKWRKFEKIAKATASDIPRQIAESVYATEFEEWVTA